MRVKAESPVQDQQTYLYQWDTTARKYFNHFETHKNAAKEGLHKLYHNLLTRFRDPIQYRHRYQDIDILYYRQLLGDISQQEVKELNYTLGRQNHSCYSKSKKEPAQIFVWKYMPISFYMAVGGGIALYARFVRGYNVLWYVGGFVPLCSYLFYNYARQPQQEIENCYKYLLAKRAATCELERNQKKFSQASFANSKELHDIQSYLKNKDITLYQFEANLIERIANGELK